MKILSKSMLLFSLIFFSCKANPKDKNPVIVHLPPVNPAVEVKQTTIGKYSYDLKKPDHLWRLPKGLVEVSGNTWLDKDHLILIEDMHPLLYLVKTGDNKNATLEKTIPFEETKKNKFDIEDVTIVGDVVYALWSHGTIFEIKNWNKNPEVEKFPTSLSSYNNLEGICFDPVTKNLLIACKDKSGIKDADKHMKAVYEFNLESKKLDSDPFLVIHSEDFKKLANDKISFNPSAIAIHPVTHDIYLLSTRGSKCMAVYNRNGQLVSFQTIDQDLMPQPEGICFSPDGTLFISSEGKKGNPGNLFEFKAR
jgi:uncharacterized protein YjiK